MCASYLFSGGAELPLYSLALRIHCWSAVYSFSTNSHSVLLLVEGAASQESFFNCQGLYSRTLV